MKPSGRVQAAGSVLVWSSSKAHIAETVRAICQTVATKARRSAIFQARPWRCKRIETGVGSGYGPYIFFVEARYQLAQSSKTGAIVQMLWPVSTFEPGESHMFRESDLLKRLVALATTGPQVIEGVADQDDGAVIAMPDGYDICATTDFVRGTGFSLFQLGHLTLRDLGRYVVAANVSDLAAMGANPFFYLSVVRYQSDRSLEEVEEILRGISEACVDFHCPLVGGDSGSYSRDVLSGTAIGILPRGKRLSRKALRPGDVLLASGELGGAAAALAAANSDLQAVVADDFEKALQRWRSPEPRVALGKALVNLPARIACMDISDGLTASLQQLSKITGLGFAVDAKALPVAHCVNSIAESLAIDAINLACSASVDFELLIGCAPQDVDLVLRVARDLATRVTPIGVAETGGLIRMTRADGHLYEHLPGVPWDHQMDDISRLFHAKG